MRRNGAPRIGRDFGSGGALFRVGFLLLLGEPPARVGQVLGKHCVAGGEEGEDNQARHD